MAINGKNKESTNLGIENVYVWGRNENGQLGFGDDAKRLKPELNPFFNDKKIRKMSLGFRHCIAIFGK